MAQKTTLPSEGKFVKNLKIAICYYLMDGISERRIITTKSPFLFQTSEVAEKLQAYPISVSREIRQLRKMGLLKYEVVDRLKGQYKLIAVGRFQKEVLLEDLADTVNRLNKTSDCRPGTQIRETLNEIRNRRLQGTSPRAEEGK